MDSIDYRVYITSDATIMLGKPIIKGTRITVSHILRLLSGGASVNDIVVGYPTLEPAAVTAALAYASDVIANESVIAA